MAQVNSLLLVHMLGNKGLRDRRESVGPPARLFAPLGGLFIPWGRYPSPFSRPSRGHPGEAWDGAVPNDGPLPGWGGLEAAQRAVGDQCSYIVAPLPLDHTGATLTACQRMLHGVSVC